MWVSTCHVSHYTVAESSQLSFEIFSNVIHCRINKRLKKKRGLLCTPGIVHNYF